MVSGDVDLSLHAPPGQCAVSACLSGGENSKLNINETSAVTFPLQLHHNTAHKEAGKYKTTKAYHCVHTSRSVSFVKGWLESDPPPKVTVMKERVFSSW